MINQKKLYRIITLSSLLFLAGCTPDTVPEEQGGYYHSGIYFGAHLSSNYKKGIRDGCITAKGKYKKSHWLFNNQSDYQNGWFLGRSKCRHLLKIDENGDLIL